VQLGRRQGGGEADNAAEASSEEATDNDPRLSLIRSLVEMLTGRRIEVFNTRNAADGAECRLTCHPPHRLEKPRGGPPGWLGHGIRPPRILHRGRADHLLGQRHGHHGRWPQHRFDLQLSMSRAYHEESTTSLRLGDAARKTDPLVLNFAGTAAQLTGQRFAFDLNADGQTEQINFVAPGSGFLVFDRNQDGKVNNGSELFGPTTNNGFQELAALDDDRNGWIDESDAAFDRLQVWTRDGAGPIDCNRWATPASGLSDWATSPRRSTSRIMPTSCWARFAVPE
jgi:hypothetical protein